MQIKVKKQTMREAILLVCWLLKTVFSLITCLFGRRQKDRNITNVSQHQALSENLEMPILRDNRLSHLWFYINFRQLANLSIELLNKQIEGKVIFKRKLLA